MLFLEGTEVMMNESIADAVQGASLRVVAIQEEPSLLSILLARSITYSRSPIPTVSLSALQRPIIFVGS